MSNEPTRSAPAASKAPEKVQQTASASPPEPIIIDLGKRSRKQVRKLRRGKQGGLASRIEDAMEHLQDNGAIAAGTQPIVVVVKEKSRTSKGGKRIAKMWGLK
jgi:hypothetical protein